MANVDLSQLGRPTALPASPDEALLETIPNPHDDADYVVRFTCPEFTSLCPITGQPDFAHLVIDYIPGKVILETKSLKLLGGYWYPRGGIPIDVFFQTGSPPEGVWIPDIEVSPHRGRG